MGCWLPGRACDRSHQNPRLREGIDALSRFQIYNTLAGYEEHMISVKDTLTGTDDLPPNTPCQFAESECAYPLRAEAPAAPRC